MACLTPAVAGRAMARVGGGAMSKLKFEITKSIDGYVCGPEAALRAAVSAAGDKDVLVAGGASAGRLTYVQRIA
jgi:hypothetical protein